jgi:hypothetical protein
MEEEVDLGWRQRALTAGIASVAPESRERRCVDRTCDGDPSGGDSREG